jgi:uncharacterized protein YcbK (DUF882 family)
MAQISARPKGTQLQGEMLLDFLLYTTKEAEQSDQNPQSLKTRTRHKQEEKRAKDARDKAISRQRIKNAIAAIQDPRKKELCQQMARIKPEGIRYLK